ncbi:MULTISPECIES: cytochrome P450 [Streptomyces]|uniref:cytochrome P450 n=1 Tax=Streptomyces TaxID=1883 RepID=UPI0007C4CF2A|nr:MULTISPECIES: cytochrome P450 [Streptomyces]
MSSCPASGPLALSAITAAADPHQHYQRLRAQWGPVARVELEAGIGAWLVMGWSEIKTICCDERLYSRDGRQWAAWQSGQVPPDSPLGPLMFWRPNVIGYDGAEHRRLRRPLEAAMAAVDQRRLRRHVQATCRELIREFAARGRADLLADYARAVPLRALAAEFGLPAEQGDELLAALSALFGSAEDAQAGNHTFETLLRAVMHERRAAPAADLTTTLLTHPDLQSDDEIHQTMVVLIGAAQEATTIWIARTLTLMLTDARFAGQLRGGRLSVDEALDEVLWRDPPMTHMPARYALADTELGGQLIRRGDALILGLAAANSDPAIHTDNPDLELGNRAHMGFSAGPHRCPARDPARVITRTAVETALNQLPGIRLELHPEEITVRPSPWNRCPTSLPVRFTPTADITDLTGYIRGTTQAPPATCPAHSPEVHP